MPMFVDVTEAEDYSTDLPCCQGKKGKRMCHNFIHIREDKAN